MERTKGAKYVFQNLQHFASISLLYKLTINAKCCKLLMGSVFVVWLANNIVELEQSFLYKYLSLERTNRAKYVSKNLQHFASISHLYKRTRGSFFQIAADKFGKKNTYMTNVYHRRR